LDPLLDGRTSARLRFEADLRTESRYQIRVQASAASPASSVRHLQNKWLDVSFSEAKGIDAFKFNGEWIGAQDFLNPFVTYDKHTFQARGYEFVKLDGEIWDGLQRVRLKTEIPMQTPEGTYASELIYTFTLFDELPYLLVDVEARYAHTPKKQVIHNLTQKLRRLMDLRWIETAPFQLTPTFTARAEKPLRVWKHNYMGITSFYDLNYGNINSKNRNLDSFNHQVTAGWVAVSNGEQGLLVGEDAGALSSMAFCPMRLRDENGKQVLSLNPFGSYYGRQLDYSHLGGNGNGTAIMQAFSGALQPNGPSFNGETLRFSLMLAPYKGDEPPQQLQNDAASHFYSPGVIVHSALSEMNAVTVRDIERFIVSEKQRRDSHTDTPLHPPTAFLANPSARAVDLVWDPPREGHVTGYEIEWRMGKENEWHALRTDPLTRVHLDGLENGRLMRFRIRSMRGDAFSAWSGEQICTTGAVTDSSVVSMLTRVPFWTMTRILLASLWSLVRANVQARS
jgi:hypothetical protein